MATGEAAMPTLGEIIKAYREAREWKQQTLADKTGTTQAYISQVERNRRTTLTVDVLRRFAGAFGVSLDDLIDATGEAPPTLESLQAEGVASDFILTLQAIEPDLSPTARKVLLETAREMSRRKAEGGARHRPQRAVDHAEGEQAPQGSKGGSPPRKSAAGLRTRVQV